MSQGPSPSSALPQFVTGNQNRRSSPSSEEPIETGTGIVKWFNDDNGFGFLTFDDRQPAIGIFVHISAVQRVGFESLKQGDRFSFRIQKRHRDGKPFASHLKLIS